MTREERIGDELRALVAERLRVDPAQVRVDGRIIQDLGLSSIDQVDFLLDIEERYPPFDLSAPEVADLTTIRDLARWIAQVSP